MLGVFAAAATAQIRAAAESMIRLLTYSATERMISIFGIQVLSLG